MCEEGHVWDNKEWMNWGILEKVCSIIKTPPAKQNVSAKLIQPERLILVVTSRST